MLKEIKLPLNLSLMEVASLLFFLIIGYLFIYRYNFYNVLGLNWYISNISATHVLISSIKIFINIIIGGLIGLIFIKIANMCKDKAELFLLIMINFLVIFLMILFYFFEYGYSGFLLYSIDMFIVMCYVSVVVTGRFAIKTNKKTNKLLWLNYICIIFIFISAPAYSGIRDAKKIIDKREDILSIAILKENKNNWYLMEVMGDKALLIKENNGDKIKNEFRLIEYKEIESIVSPVNEDMETKLINHASKMF